MAPELTGPEIASGMQYCNTFKAYADNEENFEAQLQLGSSRFPDAPIQGYTQAYWRVLQALGISNSAAHDIGVDLKSYSNNQFAVMISTEKVDGVMSSGQNLQGGQECRFSVKNFAEGASKPQRCWFCLEYDCILELKAGSVTLLN